MYDGLVPSRESSTTSTMTKTNATARHYRFLHLFLHDSNIPGTTQNPCTNKRKIQ